MVYRFHPFAKAEFEDSIKWYKERNEKTKNNFIREVLDLSDFICKNPTTFPKINSIKRTASLRKFPFSIIYVVDTEGIFIISVFHHSRNPKIWKKR
ncbi:MAG: type II toxin-antitoxin system RelE/ParE family toxin [Polaribacter sp.]